ncbi:MAG: hypothetical protein JRD47_04825, partial [Deltaproteobacteria bacterium]|nr:hypothetical protein [Deltaproteobacteria bacterium]
RLFCYVTDKVFNGINAFSDRFIARGLPRVLGRLSRHLPEILTLGAMLPLWTAFGAKGEELQVKIKKARFALETGTAPIGISAAVATIFLVVIFFLI